MATSVGPGVERREGEALLVADEGGEALPPEQQQRKAFFRYPMVFGAVLLLGTALGFLILAGSSPFQSQSESSQSQLPDTASSSDLDEPVQQLGLKPIDELIQEEETTSRRRRRRRRRRRSQSTRRRRRRGAARRRKSKKVPTKTTELSVILQEVLDRHNMYRCMHGVPLMKWDWAIAGQAKAFADKGQYKHSAANERTVNGVQSGENIAWGYPQRSGLDAATAWYDEVKYTRDGLASSPRDSTTPGKAIGHYTQVVWKASVKLGCAKGRAAAGGDMQGDFWVCQYGPAGNMWGAYEKNVLKAVKTADECGMGGGSKGGGGGNDGGSKPTPTPTPKGGGSGGGSKQTPTPRPTPPKHGSIDYTNCVPPKSVGTCEKCTNDIQCAEGFCCPYMKLCVPSSTHRCSFPVAQCSPVCGDRKYPNVEDCKPNCGNKDFPEWWLQPEPNSWCPGVQDKPPPPPTTPPPTPPCEDGKPDSFPVYRFGSDQPPATCEDLARNFCSRETVAKKCAKSCKSSPLC